MIPRRAAIVTGGAGEGIGSGITTALAAHSWAVLVLDRDRAAAEALARKLCDSGGAIEFLALDVTAADTPSIAVETALARFGRLDGLVNSAGIGMCKPLGDVTDEEYERLMDVDLRAVFRFCRAAAPELVRTGGAIVNIGSVHARITIGGYGLYAAAKAAVEGLTRGLAADYGRQMVRANCIHPGLVMSAQNRELITRFTADVDAWLASYVATKQLIPMLPTGGQVGELAAFLLSEHARTITGQAFTIDGGTSAMLYEREPGR